MLQIRQINTTGNLLILGFSDDKINTLIPVNYFIAECALIAALYF